MEQDETPRKEPSGLVAVHSVWHDSEAALLAGLLRAHGIPVTLSSEIPHAIAPLTVDGLGEVRLLVPARLAERARSLLRDYLESEAPPADGSPPEGEGPLE